MEAIFVRKTLQEIASNHAIYPIQVSQWKMQLLEGASHLFGKGRKDKETRDQQTREAKLFQEIGRLCRITSRCRRRGFLIHFVHSQALARF